MLDVDGDPELQRRYTDQVPVTFVDGAQHDFWRVDPARLKAACCGLVECDVVHRRHAAWPDRGQGELHVPPLGGGTTQGRVEIHLLESSRSPRSHQPMRRS